MLLNTDLKNNIVQTALASTKAQHNALVCTIYGSDEFYRGLTKFMQK